MPFTTKSVPISASAVVFNVFVLTAPSLSISPVFVIPFVVVGPFTVKSPPIVV